MNSRPPPTNLISRRKFLLLAGATATSAMLSACTPQLAPSTTRQNRRVQLVYQDWRTEWFPPMAQRLLEQFYHEHPDIRVYYTPDPENFEEKMLSDMEAGTAPDVFQGCCAHLPEWAQKGYTLDLRPYVEADLGRDVIEDWDTAQYAALFTRDGRQFGLPKYHGALAIYYNKDLFDEYGVPFPDENWNHDDYLATMKLLTHDRDGDGKTDLWGSMFDVSWDRIQVHVNSFGGRFVDPADPAHCLMGAEESLAAMEWLRARIWDDRVMASPLDVNSLSTRQAFISQRVAMVEDGSWALKDILDQADFRIGVAPFPAGPARRVTLATTDGFAIYTGTSYPEASWELLKFLTGKDYGRAMARASFLQPARTSLLGEWEDFIREEYPVKTEGMDLSVFSLGQVGGYSVTVEIFRDMAEAKRIAYEAWSDIFRLGQAPVSRMKEACLDIENAQKSSGVKWK